MKKLISFILVLTPILVFALGNNPQMQNGSPSVPSKARTFISTHFPNCAIEDVDRDVYYGEVCYDIELDCGIMIASDHLGEWIEVDCGSSEVPDALVPAYILAYIANEYTDAYIVRIERGSYNDKVDLNMGHDLVFSKDGELKYVYD